MRPIALFTAGGASLAMARHIPMSPVVTAAPDPNLVDLRLREAALNPPPNLLSVAQVLLTALPSSLFEVAASDPAAVPPILWSEFLDDSVPAWFANLPEDIRSYLVDAWKSLAHPSTSACTTSCTSTIIISPSQTNSPSLSTPTAHSSSTQSHSSDSIATTTIATSSIASSILSSSTSRISSHSTGSASRITELSTTTSSGTSPTSSTSSITTSSSSTGSSIATSTTFATTTIPSPSNLPPPAAEPSQVSSDSVDHGLSKASKIGIGVGVPLGFLAIAALLLLCCLRRRRNGRLNEKEPDSDAAPFVAPAAFYGDAPGRGPYGSYRPYGPYTQIPDENIGFNDAPVVGGAADGPYRELAPLDTDPYMDPHSDATVPPDAWEATQHPVGAGMAGYTNLRSSPHRRRRRGSASSLRSIEEEADEDGDLANAGTAITTDDVGKGDGPMISSVQPSRDPMAPPFPRDTAEDVAHQQYTAFRSGSLKRNRSHSSGALPVEDLPRIDTNPYLDEAQNSSSSSGHLERRRSRSIGGGYRSLPSPHLQSPSQTQPYLLPRGEWLEDGEDLPPSATMNRNMF